MTPSHIYPILPALDVARRPVAGLPVDVGLGYNGPMTALDGPPDVQASRAERRAGAAMVSDLSTRAAEVMAA